MTAAPCTGAISKYHVINTNLATIYPEIFAVRNFHGFHGRSSNRKNLVCENG